MTLGKKTDETTVTDRSPGSKKQRGVLSKIRAWLFREGTQHKKTDRAATDDSSGGSNKQSPKEPSRSPWLLLLVFSALFIVTGALLIKGSSEWGRVFAEIGFALIAAGITAITLNIVVGFVFSKMTSQEIAQTKEEIENTKKEIENTKKDLRSTITDLENAISIYRDSKEIGLENLFPDREQAMERIQTFLRDWEAPLYSRPNWQTRQMPELKPIYLIGISLRDFCHVVRQPTTVEPEKTTYEALRKLLERAQEHGWGPENPIVRVLVTNPLGYQAMLRMHREEQEEEPGVDSMGANQPPTEAEQEEHLFDPNVFQRANLYIEVGRTLRVIDAWKGKGLPIDIRAYTASPSCFVVLVPDKSLFVEQYHYGTPRDRVSGGQAPVLEFSPKAAIYSQIEAHARFIWETSHDQGLDVLRKSLENIGICRDIWEQQRTCTKAWEGKPCNGWSPSPGTTPGTHHPGTPDKGHLGKFKGSEVVTTTSGKQRQAEVHWHEPHDPNCGRTNVKIKRFLD